MGSSTGPAGARVLGAMTAVPLPTPPARPILAHMTGVTVRHRGRLSTSLLVASSLALLLLVIAAASAAAAPGALSNPSVSPNPAVVGSTVTFRVTYTDAGGVAPQYVRVYTDAALTKSVSFVIPGSGNWAAGVTLTATTTTLAAGSYPITFRVRDSNGTRTSIPGGTLVINPAPSPTPTPTPKPSTTPTPTPTPTHSPTATPTHAPTPTHTPKPTAVPTPKPTSGSGTGTTSGGSTPTQRPPTVTKTAGPSVGPSPAASASAGPGAVTVGDATDGSTTPTNPMAKIRGSDAYLGTLTGYQSAHGIGDGGESLGLPYSPYGDPGPTPNQILTALLPTIATAAAGGAAWAAFAFFGKRRRDDDEVDQNQLATAAATSYEAQAAPGLRVVDESLMPRWRRPSLQEVRRTDPLRAMADATHLSFDTAGASPLADCERRSIGYRLVRLLDSPDEYRSTEIGVLDQGDEVQLLRRQGVYWLVLCPDGRQGWVHRMTLAEPARPEIDPLDPEPMPQYVDDDPQPGLQDTESDLAGGGLLEAYMKARGEIT